jgi:tRNA-modifying protein YgfZ
MLEGYDALRESAAWLDLSARGRTEAFGRDRARLLHNLTTNHVKQLQPGQGCYAFLLTPQGRIQADIHILALEDRFLLDTEPETRERVPQVIGKYIIADDVKLEDVSGRTCELAIEGPGAAAALAAAGAPAPEAPWDHAAWEGAIVAAISSTGQPGFRLIAPAERKADLAARLEAAGASQASPEAARVVRMENGVPRYGEEIFETSLPQETRQMHAVHFNKGCYMGQEIVERIRARGHVNKLLMKVLIEGEAPLARGAKLEAGGAEAGEIASSVFSPAAGRVVALAYVRTPHARPGAELTARGRAAVVA